MYARRTDPWVRDCCIAKFVVVAAWAGGGEVCVLSGTTVWEQSPTCDVLAHVPTADRSTRPDGGTNAALAMAMMKAIEP